MSDGSSSKPPESHVVVVVDPAEPAASTKPAAPPDAPAAAAPAAASTDAKPGAFKRLRTWASTHHRTLWWLHSAWALTLGVVIMLIANKGFAHARLLTLFLGGAWLLILTLFRIFGSGMQQRVETKGAKVGFVAMNYVLKDLYQAMLFFALPFYWKSSTWGTANGWFPVVVAACALVATLDVVFDHVVMRWRILASFYYLLAIFLCLNLVVPAMLPGTPALWALLAASGISVAAFLSLHIRLRTLFTRWGMSFVVLMMAAAMTGAYAGRRAVPPVPYHAVDARVVTVVEDEWKPGRGVSTVAPEDVPRVVAYVDVASPSGREEAFFHVWRLNGAEVARVEPVSREIPGSVRTVRYRSSMPLGRIPLPRAGSWTVDLETSGRQIVGRASFEVKAGRAPAGR